MPLLALKRLKSYISKKYFYTFGVKSANKTARILVISSLLTTLISYSVVLQLIYPPRQSTTDFIDGYAWQFSPHITTAASYNTKYIAQQIHIATTDRGVITKEQVKTTFDIYKVLTESRVTLKDKTVTLRDICATSLDSACLVHSPLPFWNLKNLDNEFVDYKSIVNKRMQHKDSSTHPHSTMSNVQFDQKGIFQSADSLILTFILKNDTMDVWDALWQHTKNELNLFQHQLNADPLLLQYKWKVLPLVSWKAIVVLACAVGVFLYVRALFSQTNLLKSKSGLGISVLFLSFACFTTTVGLLRYVKYETVTPWPFQLLACTTSTLEHALLLTSAVISRGKDIGRNERIGKGFQQVGVSMTSTLIGELVVLLLGSTMNDEGVKSFCLFSSIAFVVAYILNLTLFTAILSIDIRRAELTDLGSEGDNKFEAHKHDSFDQKFKSKRAINVLVLCFILLYLSVFKPLYIPTKHLAIVVDDNLKYKELTSIAHQFWQTLNPFYENTWLEIQPPYIVFTHNDNGLSATNQLNYLQSNYNEKLSILCSSITSHDGTIPDFLSPLVLILLKINVPSFMLSIILVGIILWMIPSIREGILLPVLRKIFVRTCLFLLRCISRVTPLKTDYLIRKVENDYNEEGMHMGAISIQSQYNKLQNQNCVRNVTVRTLAGKHIPDLKFLDASLKKIVSTDQFGKIILWDAVENKWLARLDHLRLLGNSKRWLAETNPEYFDYDDYDDYVNGVCKQAPRAHCIKINKEGKWVTVGFDDGAILVWDTEFAQLVREFSINEGNKSPFLDHNENEEGLQNRKRKDKNKHEDITRTRLHDRVLKLEFLSNNHLLSVHKSGTFREWDIKSGEMVQQFKSGHVREITNICVLTNRESSIKKEEFLLSSSKDGMVQCWKRHSCVKEKTQWKHMYSIQEHAEITSLAAQQLHNGMGVLVTGSIDNAVKVWDLNHGNALCTLSQEGKFKKKTPEAEVGGPLLQFSRVAESSGVNQPTLSGSSILKQDMVISDHTDSICQVAITRIGNPEFENDCCPSCHVVVDSGFFVASSSMDNTVHTWRLDRHTGKDIVGCTTCFKDYHRQQHYTNSRTWKPEVPGTPRTGFRYQKRNRKENNHSFTSGDESEPDIMKDRLSVLPKFLGKLDQTAGRGIIFCENMVLAGVRRRHPNNLESRAEHQREHQWEAWFASLQYYEPPSLEEEASLIPVITLDLEDDNDPIKKDNIPKHSVSSSSLWEQILFHTFGIKKVRPSANRPIRMRKQQQVRLEMKKKKKYYTDVNDEDDEAFDNLPFSAIRQVISIDGYGFCCDYGNFIKIVAFDGPNGGTNRYK